MFWINYSEIYALNTKCIPKMEVLPRELIYDLWENNIWAGNNEHFWKTDVQWHCMSGNV